MTWAGRLAAASALLLGAMSAAMAQSDDTGAPEAGEVYIENIAPQPLTFGLSPDNASWERFSLEPD